MRFWKKRVFSLLMVLTIIVSSLVIPNVNIMAADIASILNSAKLNPMPTGYPQVDNKINSIIAEGRSKTKSNYELVKWLYDYCIYHTSYGYGDLEEGVYSFTEENAPDWLFPERTYMAEKDYGYVTPFPDWLVAESILPLFHGKGTCNNYTAQFMLIMRALGYEANYFSGETRKAGGGYTGHAWCEVKINGTNYIFDTQVEDNVAEQKGKIIYLYFCKTEAEMSERYIWNWDSINSKIENLGSEPKLKSLESYLEENNLKSVRAISVDDLKKQISNIIASGDDSEYMIILNGKMNETEVDNYLESVSLESKTYRGANIPELLKNKYMSGNYESLKATYACTKYEETQGVDAIGFKAVYTLEENKYIYDETNLAKNINIPTKELEKLETKEAAEDAVESLVDDLSNEEKVDSNVIDLVLLYSEEAVSKVNNIETDKYEFNASNEIIDNNVKCEIEDITKILKRKEINVPRSLSTQISVSMPSDKKITVKSASSKGKAKSIKCRTDYASVVIPVEKDLTVSMENKGENKVAVNFGKKNTNSVVKVSFPGIIGEGKEYAVFDEKGNVLGGKYNPITKELEVKINESGIFSVKNNEKSFSDIKNKSQEVQEAIELLASKGVINGTSPTEFSPDSSITRAEVVSLICRIISKYDPNEDGGFTDVTKAHWYFGAAGSGKKQGIINGYADNTFRGEYIIPKIQILSMSARVLKKEMNYNSPSNSMTILSEFTDRSDIADWGRDDIALANQANLIVKRKDSTFVPNDEMTRADAAVVLKRLYDKIW